ncbi:MAG: hypothetical protein JXR58_09635 [Bacteroidales bacterium]|nr:hypothetical protein [Bacteroidales bacterium]
MSILIADSGSSKTDWCYISEKKERLYFQTEGLNPYFVNSQKISEVASAKFSGFSKEITKVFFYGSGCANAEKNLIVENGLKIVFPKAEIFVFSDILGAAKALFGNEEGIAVILGTGQATCFYSDNKIVNSLPSGGFLLGDEGSGAYLGLQFLKKYLHKEIPEDIFIEFERRYNTDIQQIKNSLYSAQHSGKYLASFAPFIHEYKNRDVINEIISEAFGLLIEKYILRYHDAQKLKLGFCGSIAYFFKDNLETACSKYNLKPFKIIEKPIEELVGI